MTCDVFYWPIKVDVLFFFEDWLSFSGVTMAAYGGNGGICWNQASRELHGVPVMTGEAQLWGSESGWRPGCSLGQCGSGTLRVLSWDHPVWMAMASRSRRAGKREAQGHTWASPPSGGGRGGCRA